MFAKLISLTLLSWMLLVASAANLRPADDSWEFSWDDPSETEDKKRPKAISKSIEKGVRCKGDMKEGKAGKTCQAGMCMNATVNMNATEMMEETTFALHGQLMEMMPSAVDLMPDNDMLEAIKMFDVNEEDKGGESLVETLEDGFSKTLAFGGKAHVDFGCNVTFAKKDGKFTKSVKCGMKGAVGIGKKEEEDDGQEDSLFKQE